MHKWKIKTELTDAEGNNQLRESALAMEGRAIFSPGAHLSQTLAGYPGSKQEFTVTRETGFSFWHTWRNYMSEVRGQRSRLLPVFSLHNSVTIPSHDSYASVWVFLAVEFLGQRDIHLSCYRCHVLDHTLLQKDWDSLHPQQWCMEVRVSSRPLQPFKFVPATGFKLVSG